MFCRQQCQLMPNREAGMLAMCQLSFLFLFDSYMSRLTAFQAFYKLPLATAVQELHADPDFVRLRKSGRANPGPMSFWNSDVAKDMNLRASGSLLADNSLAIELFVDWAQVYHFRKHSTGLVFARCAMFWLLLFEV